MRFERAHWYVILALATIFLARPQPGYSERRGMATWRLRFKDRASGGTLMLALNRNRTVKWVTVSTSEGESPESVAERLADTINGYVSRDTERSSYDRNTLWVGGYEVSTSDGALVLPRGLTDYVLAGTETGLGIPQPPTSLSSSSDGNKVVLRWINPSTPYDFVFVKAYWRDFDNMFDERLPGSAESFVIDTGKIPLDSQNMDFRVIGVRDNIPSNAASIHVSGSAQAELDGIPFTSNVAPNWKAWTTDGKPDTSAFECVDKYPQ